MQRATDPAGRIPSPTQSEGGSHDFPALRRPPPDLTARFTPGALISSCEVFDVLHRGWMCLQEEKY